MGAAAATEQTDEFILLPYQSSWTFDRSPVKVGEKGRQEGFTWATACESVQEASTRKSDGGLDVYFMSTSQDDAREFISECAAWVHHFAPVMRASPDVEEFDWIDEENDPVAIQTYRIRFPSGGFIYALPSRPARMRGKKRCLAICDEAAHHDLDEWMAASGAIEVWGGRRAIISTHRGTGTAFYRYIQDVKASIADGKPIASLHSVFLDDALKQGLYRRICRLTRQKWSPEKEIEWVEGLRRRHGDAFDEEFRGIIKGGSNQLIARPLILAAQILPPAESWVVEFRGGNEPRMAINGDLVATASKPWPLPSEQIEDISTPEERTREVRRWLDEYLAPLLMKVNDLGLDVHVGDDYGRSGDLSAKVIGTNDRMNRRAVRILIECEKVPWTVQDQIGDACWRILSRLRSGSGDGNGNGSNSAEHASEVTRRKIAVTKHLPDSAFTKLRSRLEEGSLVLPRHAGDLADDIASIKRKNNGIDAPRRRTARGQQRHADAAYALAHFEHSIDTDGKVVAISNKRRPFKSLFPRPR